jgi:hypothetical protein
MHEQIKARKVKNAHRLGLPKITIPLRQSRARRDTRQEESDGL